MPSSSFAVDNPFEAQGPPKPISKVRSDIIVDGSGPFWPVADAEEFSYPDMFNHGTCNECLPERGYKCGEFVRKVADYYNHYRISYDCPCHGWICITEDFCRGEGVFTYYPHGSPFRPYNPGTFVIRSQPDNDPHHTCPFGHESGYESDDEISSDGDQRRQPCLPTAKHQRLSSGSIINSVDDTHSSPASSPKSAQHADSQLLNRPSSSERIRVNPSKGAKHLEHINGPGSSEHVSSPNDYNQSQPPDDYFEQSQPPDKYREQSQLSDDYYKHSQRVKPRQYDWQDSYWLNHDPTTQNFTPIDINNCDDNNSVMWRSPIPSTDTRLHSHSGGLGGNGSRSHANSWLYVLEKKG